MKTWIVIIIKWFLGVFTGPRSKSRIRVEVKDEAVIAQERKHYEQLKKEVERLERELKTIPEQAPKLIEAGDCDNLRKLNAKRNELHEQWHAAKQQLDDFERYLGK